MLTVKYAHMCEKAFLSQNGAFNLIGIFEKIASPTFPVIFPQLSIVTSLEGKGGKYLMEINVVSKKKEEPIMSPIMINITIEEKNEALGTQNLRIIGDINNLVIKEIGNYEVQIFLSGEKVYTIPFSVELATRPIPEGR